MNKLKTGKVGRVRGSSELSISEPLVGIHSISRGREYSKGKGGGGAGKVY